MAEKVKLSKDGSSIDFVQSESIPTSTKKFRQSPEIEGFYRFIFENDLQKEAFDILDRIITERKLKKAMAKKEARALAKESAAQEKAALASPKTKAPVTAKVSATAKPATSKNSTKSQKPTADIAKKPANVVKAAKPMPKPKPTSKAAKPADKKTIGKKAKAKR